TESRDRYHTARRAGKTIVAVRALEAQDAVTCLECSRVGDARLLTSGAVKAGSVPEADDHVVGARRNGSSGHRYGNEIRPVDTARSGPWREFGQQHLAAILHEIFE